MSKNKQTIFQYDPEADILSWEITGRPIEYAKEIGNAVIHFSKNHSPVLIEILEATKLLTSALGVLRKNGVTLPKPTPALLISCVIQGGFSAQVLLQASDSLI